MATKDLTSGGVLLTGVTGFVGMELLVRYLELTGSLVMDVGETRVGV
jgi:hypothetical protein